MADPVFTRPIHLCHDVQPRHHMGIIQRLMLGRKIPVWIKKGQNTYLNSFANQKGYIISVISQQGVINEAVVIIPIRDNLVKNFPPSYLKLARVEDGKPMNRNKFEAEKELFRDRKVLTAVDCSQIAEKEEVEEGGEIDYEDEPSPNRSRSRSRSRSPKRSPSPKRKESPKRKGIKNEGFYVYGDDPTIDLSKYHKTGKKKSISQVIARKKSLAKQKRSRAPAAQKFEDEVKRRQSGRAGKILVNQLSVADLKKLIKKGVFRGTPFQHYVAEARPGAKVDSQTQKNGKGQVEVNESNAFLVKRALVQVHPEQFTAEVYSTL